VYHQLVCSSIKNVIIKSEATEAVFKNTDRSIIILWTKFFMFLKALFLSPHYGCIQIYVILITTLQLVNYCYMRSDTCM